MQARNLTDQLEALAKTAGASLTGVAPVSRFEGAPRGHHPCELLPGAKSVLVFGIRILDRVLEWPDLLAGSEMITEEIRREVLHDYFYRHSGYDIINNRLNQVALTVANFLEDAGHPSLFFPATYGELPSKTKNLPAMLSQRHAAVRAGLGEFGLNNVVVTERYGPRIRWNSVLTNAELEPSPLLTEKVCLGSACSKCLEECRGEALRPLPEADENAVWLDPPSRTDWVACRGKRVEIGCVGRCLRVCPVGR